MCPPVRPDRRAPSASPRALRSAGVLSAAVLVACGGGSGPTAPASFRADGFPAGDATVFGVALDPSTGAPLANLPVVLTPDDGLPLEQELANPLQAEAATNRRGEFTLNGLAAGPYVLFVRFDANHLGYGEVVGRVTAGRSGIGVQLSPAPIALAISDPPDGGTVSAADTAHLSFRDVLLEDLLTLAAETRPVFARVLVYGNGGGGSEESSSPPRPRPFEVELEDAELRNGSASVPIDVGGLGDPVRLEPYLGLHVVYTDPRGGPPGVRVIRGRPISVVGL